MNTAHRLALLALPVLLVAPPTAACRYSVRDIGFVDDDGAAPSIQLAGPADSVEPIEAALRRQCEAIGLKPRVVTASGAQLEIALRQGDTDLPLTATATEPSEIASEIVKALAPTKADRKLLRTLIANPCVVLLIGADGPSPASNAVQQGVRRAIDEAELWAKPMVGEPQIQSMDAQAVATSRVLLWSLGVEDFDQPTALVVYGRLRRMGPVLAGERLDAASVARTIALLGKDCECDLDRGVFEGPAALHAWDDELAAAAREALDFDPQHPMTELEVRQILAKKTNANRPAASDADVFWGYEEVDLLAAVEAMPTTDPSAEPDPATSASRNTAAVAPPTPDRWEDRPQPDLDESSGGSRSRVAELMAVVGVATAASAMTGWFLLRRQTD